MALKTTPLSGGLLINKPSGLTSHDVIDKVRQRLKITKVGHSGTLDPFATGLLLIGIGSSTRLLDYTHALPKTYAATLRLGAASTTDDGTGNITSDTHPPIPTHQEIMAVLQRFLGPQEQSPPAYAAIKVKGKKLYEYAREGQSVTVPTRKITIYACELRQYQYPDLTIMVQCSSGTYIRALGRDVGLALGTHAYVTDLERTQIGPWQVSAGIALETLTAAIVSSHLLSPQALVAHMPTVVVSEVQAEALRQGMPILWEQRLAADQPLAVQLPQEQLVGIGHYEASTRQLFPDKVLS